MSRFFRRSYWVAVIAALMIVSDNECSQAQAPVELVVSSKSVTRVSNTNSISSLPKSASGTILLCGGGALPREIRERFHEEGRGPEGSLVLIPTASTLSDTGDFSNWVDYWSTFSWKSVHVLHAKDRESAMQDEHAQALLQNATAVWISGGDQRRLADRYAGTPIENGIASVLARGGIVGGTSAGAAIASSVMISGGWIDPQMTHGFSILSNAIVDQHFSQKRRFERLARAVFTHPQRLGIGIDESTGLFINKEKTKVVGDGAVFLFRSNTPAEDHDVSEAFLSIQTARLLPGDEINSQDLEIAPTVLGTR